MNISAYFPYNILPMDPYSNCSLMWNLGLLTESSNSVAETLTLIA